MKLRELDSNATVTQDGRKPTELKSNDDSLSDEGVNQDKRED